MFKYYIRFKRFYKILKFNYFRAKTKIIKNFNK